ncbi:MAG TPA: acyl-CoA dehydrogenase family protein [Gemmatimonadaceae bacterium]
MIIFGNASRMADFHQDPPKLENTYTGDAPLRALLGRLLPKDVWHTIDAELSLLGSRAAGDILALGDAAEASPPRHIPFDAWGHRVDRLEISDAWQKLERIAAAEGLVALAYERNLDALSRVDQFARVYLFHPSSATVTCPFAMADGAARCLELHGGSDERLQVMQRHLTSRDQYAFWTSGQWMTERTGGSDVSGTTTVARCIDGEWRLYGDKWFTSATTAQMALTLARIEGAKDLSLFALETRDSSGTLQRIRVNRLKDKLGTRALPTAELTLDGTPAILVDGEGHGVKKMAPVLTITRVWNTFCASSLMRRAVALSVDYARRRQAFGRRLIDLPLHAETLAAMEVETRGATQLGFNIAQLLGREENGAATDDERALLRLLVPIAKLMTGKQAVAVASEALESFGGAGYIETTGLPRLLRDAQVLPIWEGTTNVLSLDVLRALGRTDALAALRRHVERSRSRLTSKSLIDGARLLQEQVQRLEGHANDIAKDADNAAASARDLAMTIGRAYTGTLLLEQAEADAASGSSDATVVASRWCATTFSAADRLTIVDRDLSRSLVEGERTT